MASNDTRGIGTSRRRMLGTMASTGALLGLGSAAAHAATVGAGAAGSIPEAAEDLFALARLRSYKNLTLLKLGSHWRQRRLGGRGTGPNSYAT